MIVFISARIRYEWQYLTLMHTSVHSASEAFATMRYINWCFTYLLTYLLSLVVVVVFIDRNVISERREQEKKKNLHHQIRLQNYGSLANICGRTIYPIELSMVLTFFLSHMHKLFPRFPANITPMIERRPHRPSPVSRRASGVAGGSSWRRTTVALLLPVHV